MNRKLLILDVVLGAGVILGGIQLHDQWVAAKARQAGMPGPAVKPAAVPLLAPLPQQPAVLPSGFKTVADNLLFDPSRNPNVPVDKPPDPPPPPPPPPLPSFHGSMDLGQGAFALMSENGQTGYQEVHAGEMIGPFKLLSFNRKEFDVEWNDKVIHVKSGDANNKGNDNGPATGRPVAGDGLKPTLGIIPGAAQQQAAPEQPQPTQQLGPGVQMTDSERACVAGDGAADGTVSGGYRKVHDPTPLGSRCVWRAVGK